ncbi:sensor histidine kinase [Leptolyngbya sp. O-77]|uniref:sensor histidine kinase n=1 Tax=Leptolyngbya sp. O-77 TaxID=1080068 RepID=UPI00074D4656|nr:ATP-binding protein [Leptolyngbya sp. O-77]BAU44373.1 sensory histidine kinase AtoS [Leptolyngbya sp. O-77]
MISSDFPTDCPAASPLPEVLPQGFLIPRLRETNIQVLSSESTLEELPLHDFQADYEQTGLQVAAVFEQHPALPGVVLWDAARFVGMLSRQRLLEYLLRPHGTELFLSRPLKVLHSYACQPPLVLPGHTPILAAAQQVLRRSPDQFNEPIVVQADGAYYLLSPHELNRAHWQIRGIETQVRYERTQVQLIQSEKMAGLGRLVDGVAHEILDPVGFIWGNLSHVSSYAADLLDLVAAYEASLPSVPPAVQQLQHAIELEYVKRDLPQAIASIRAGAERLKNLATSLQNFCHVDEVYPKPANLHECLDSIVLLLKSRLTGEIDIVCEYGHLPPVPCFIGQLSQVFMNILINAVEALLDSATYQSWVEGMGDRPTHAAAGSLRKPQIVITTAIQGLSDPSPSGGTSANPSGAIAPADSEPFKTTTKTAQFPPGSTARNERRWVSVRITDNGPGLSPETQQRILESFTVERRAAKETSLSVSYQIVTAKHGGQFRLKSPALFPTDAPAGIGTEFEILLPLF